MQRVVDSRTLLLLLTCLVPCAGCTSLDANSSGGRQGLESSDAPLAREIEAAELELELGRDRLALEIAEQEAAALKHESSLSQVQAEVELAKAASTHFERIEAPNKLAREKLDLRSVQDRAREAAEELAQIEIMYKDQDLDDLTAEFVVSRGKRNAERAAARIAIQEQELLGLEKHELPQEGKRLDLEQQKALENLKRIHREGKNSARAKAILVKEARGKVTRLEAVLEDLREKEAE